MLLGSKEGGGKPLIPWYSLEHFVITETCIQHSLRVSSFHELEAAFCACISSDMAINVRFDAKSAVNIVKFAQIATV